MDIETYLKLLVIKAVWSCQTEFLKKIPVEKTQGASRAVLPPQAQERKSSLSPGGCWPSLVFFSM